MAGVERLELHADRGHSRTIDSDADDIDRRLETGEVEEVKVGKKRQIVSILVREFLFCSKNSGIDVLSRYCN